MKKKIFIGIIAVCCCVSGICFTRALLLRDQDETCQQYESLADVPETGSSYLVSLSEAGGTEREDKSMYREICKVTQAGDEFELENLKGEVYNLNPSLIEEYKEGDNVILIYRSRQLTSSGKYSADVYAIYRNEDQVLQSGN